MQQKTYNKPPIHCLYDEKAIDSFSPDMLSAHYWQQNNAVTGTAQGRGTTYFVQFNEQQWVLRHYYRGGLIGKLIHDSYWFTGLENTRAAAEFSLLTRLNELNLPAPKPIAYRVIKSGFTYRADILTGRIENAQDLVGLLSTQEISAELWQEIGRVVKTFHQHGIYHHDLNCHNILIDDQDKVWVIDFDRGEERPIESSWQQNNVERLKRSFNKELNKLDKFYFDETCWQQLMKGYQQ